MAMLSNAVLGHLNLYVFCEITLSRLRSRSATGWSQVSVSRSFVSVDSFLLCFAK